MSPKHICVAMSGGVDSAGAALLLRQAGYEVSGVTLRLHGYKDRPGLCGSADDIEQARQVAASIGIPHQVLDLSELFCRKVMDKFVSEYVNGRTPNPCICCNRTMKFGIMLDRALELGCRYVVSGHYARIRQDESTGRYLLYRAVDLSKDQSYVLWSLTQDQISHFVAPLGEFSKKEVREIAEKYGIPVAHKSDSQDICFIPNGDYREFLNRVGGNKDSSGDFVLADGTRLGKHLGQSHYTVGQRKGLGIAYKEPLYVIGRDMKKNSVILGSNNDLFTTKFTVRSASFSALDFPESDFECQVRIRYRASFVSARLVPIGDGRLLVETQTPVRAATPGQSAVFYDGETLLGGGIIEG